MMSPFHSTTALLVGATAMILFPLINGFIPQQKTWLAKTTASSSLSKHRFVPSPFYAAVSWSQQQQQQQQQQQNDDDPLQSQQRYSPTTSSSASHSSSSSSSLEEEIPSVPDSIQVVVVQGHEDPLRRVVDVAAFRHNLINPEMMVQAAQAKRDAWDVSRDILEAVVIGYAMAGPFGAVLEYSQTQHVPDAMLAYAISGTAVALTMSVANILERNVLHVPTIEEATQRIVEDYEEGVLRGQDVVFAALWNHPTPSSSSSSFTSTNGVVGCVDVELRNSKQSPKGVPTVPGIPSHLHLQNMLMHDSVQPKGIGMALLQEIYRYAKTHTDAQMLTVEVHDLDTAAISLYHQAGFEQMRNPNSLSGLRFMKKDLC